MRMYLLSSLCAVCLASVGCIQTAEQRMITDLQKVDSRFDAEEIYAAYLKKHGENAQRLRDAAAACATMRFRIHGGGGGYMVVDEYLPLSEGEVEEVRKFLAQIEETPARDFSNWLKIYHEYQICPVAAPPPYFIEFQFVSSTGDRLYYFEGYDAPIGDKAKAEEYRTALSRPYYMLPAESLRRWNEQDFLKRIKARHHELLESYKES